MRNFKLLLIILVMGSGILNAQTQNINMHSGSETTSFANFYDSGGETTNYQDNEDITMTVYPENSTDKLCVKFHRCQTIKKEIIYRYILYYSYIHCA